MAVAPANIALNYKQHPKFEYCNSSSNRGVKYVRVKPSNCTSPIQQQVESGILCECCSGKGWLVCEFCKGQKTNVRAENNRIYRRCPSCKAIGSILCWKCKVYKCVTFPDDTDGEVLSL